MSHKKYRLADLADKISAQIQGDPECWVNSIGTLQSASNEELAFIANSRYQKYLKTTSAAAVILSPADLEFFSGNALIVDNPYLAYAQLSREFLSAKNDTPGISRSAHIEPTAVVSKSASIGPGVVIASNSHVGKNVVVGANTVIGRDCIVSSGSRISANVTLYDDVHIGEECLIHSGAVIGADGFGFANHEGEWVKIAQLGGVRIGDKVEVGAGTTIDRGALDHTLIEDGVILDNQIQVAHNVQIGKNSAIAGCTAIAGSTKIGERCTIAGACGITGHLDIASGTHITAMTLVTKSITEPGVYSSGTGMLEHKQWKKSVVRFRQLDDVARRLKSLEDMVIEIKGS
ncbi:MAG: UDP-3-O-(3-hydroxymyristoyl)glucosamine N-acyltransferase [Neptuniibacter sp.]